MLFRIFKRIEDIVFSTILLIFFLPILIPISFISFLVQGWPVFYVSKRMISSKKEIKIFKFRTMVKDAKSDKYGLKNKYMKSGYLDIPLTSEVFTPFGIFLEITLCNLVTAFILSFGRFFKYSSTVLALDCNL